MSIEVCQFTDGCRCTTCLNERYVESMEDHLDDVCPECDRFYDDCTCEGDETDPDCGLCMESGLMRCECDDGPCAVPDEFPNDDECDFTEEDVVT